jgi:hypothetical protein
MTRFPTPAHLACWAGFAPGGSEFRRAQEGPCRHRTRQPLPDQGPRRHGNPRPRCRIGGHRGFSDWPPSRRSSPAAGSVRSPVCRAVPPRRCPCVRAPSGRRAFRPSSSTAPERLTARLSCCHTWGGRPGSNLRGQRGELSRLRSTCRDYAACPSVVIYSQQRRTASAWRSARSPGRSSSGMGSTSRSQSPATGHRPAVDHAFGSSPSPARRARSRGCSSAEEPLPHRRTA